jgi:hypothetical protein
LVEIQARFARRSWPGANFIHAQAATDNDCRGHSNDSLLSNRPCLACEYKIQEIEPVRKLVGACVGIREPKWANSIPFPISLKIVWFSLDVWGKEFKILAVSRFSHFGDYRFCAG